MIDAQPARLAQVAIEAAKAADLVLIPVQALDSGPGELPGDPSNDGGTGSRARSSAAPLVVRG